MDLHAAILIRDEITADNFVVFDDVRFPVSVNKLFGYFPAVHLAAMTADMQQRVRKMLKSKVKIGEGCILPNELAQIVVVIFEKLDQPIGFFVCEEEGRKHNCRVKCFYTLES